MFCNKLSKLYVHLEQYFILGGEIVSNTIIKWNNAEGLIGIIVLFPYYVCYKKPAKQQEN